MSVPKKPASLKPTPLSGIGEAGDLPGHSTWSASGGNLHGVAPCSALDAEPAPPLYLLTNLENFIEWGWGESNSQDIATTSS